MRRVAPSVIARDELNALLARGPEAGQHNIVSLLLAAIGRLVVQELVEGEQEDFLGGRGRYERRGEDQRGSRNGYLPGRIRTAEGVIPVQVPQVRGAGEPFRSTLMSFLEGNSEVLDRLVVEVYARGMSTRDIEDAFRGADGELLISKTAVSQITDRLWEDYQAFICRDLSGLEIHYLFADAIFESLRRQGRRRRCWWPGVSPPTAASSCCTWRWATRSPRRAGRSFSAACWVGACAHRPPSPATEHRD